MQDTQKIQGLDSTWQKMSGLISARAFGQTTLFYGTEGIGKKRLALKCAQALLCDVGADSHESDLFTSESDQDQNRPCGKCTSCEMFAREIHPDFYFVAPSASGRTKKEKTEEDEQTDSGSTAENKNTKSKNFSLRIDQIRELQKKLQFAPLQSRHQVIVMDDLDKMTRETANSVLKILEEPRPQQIFILITSRLGKILPTIRSRSVRVFVRSPSRDFFSRIIKETWPQDTLSEDLTRQLYHCFEASPGRALQALENKVLPGIMPEVLPDVHQFSAVSDFAKKIKSQEDSFGLIMQVLRWEILAKIKSANAASLSQINFFSRINQAEMQKQRHISVEFILENLFL